MKAKKLTLSLPPEFIALCERHGVPPETVLRGFIADLCGLMNWADNPRADGFSSNGSDERELAYAYYRPTGVSAIRLARVVRQVNPRRPGRPPRPFTPPRGEIHYGTKCYTRCRTHRHARFQNPIL